MELFQAIRERRSCRDFDPRPVEEEKLWSVIEAGGWAPSVMNLQPWRFLVVKNPEVKRRIKDSAELTRRYLFEASGWKWVSKYSVDFLEQAPVLIGVVGDPKNTGGDAFLAGRGEGYAMSCCAAVQNMLLAAHAMGLTTLWYTLYEKDKIKEILDIPAGLDLVSIVVLGYAAKEPPAVRRKPVAELTMVIE